MTPQHSSPARSATGFFGYFVAHRTAANLLLLLMLIAGAVAGSHIRAQFFPDVAVDTISVTITWSGVGPKEIDEAIVARVEPKLRAVEGVKTLIATARQGSANLRLEFQPDWDIATALDDVKSSLDEVRDLPEDAEEPVIRRAVWHDRVTDVLISGDTGVDHLHRWAEDLKRRLFRNGVTLTSISGISDPEIRVDVRPKELERYGLTLQNIASAIESETGTQPVGEIEGAGARIRTSARDLTPEAIAAIAIRSLPDGTKLRVRDVAHIVDEGIDREIALLHEGKPAVLVEIDRDAKGDAIALQAKVEAAVRAISPSLPHGVTMQLVHPRAEAIIDRLDILIRNGIAGLAIVVVLLFLFLSARTAFWVAAGIPVAMAATLAFMYAFGFTFNMVSLFALIICLGIVVDDAIVVGEHADHLARRGLSPHDAATQAAHRMAAPVFSASITTVVAFAVLSLIGGRFGRMVADIPFTVAVVILASLIESFLILPAHMRHALAHGGRQNLFDLPSRIVNRGFTWLRDRPFSALVGMALRLRYPLIAGALLLLAVSVSAIIDRTVRWQFFSSPERATIRANIAMLNSATRSDTKTVITELDRALQVVNTRFESEHGRAPVTVALAKVGATSGRGLTGADSKDPDLLASYEIELIDPDIRTYTAFDFIQSWREEIREHPLLETLSLRGDRSGPGGDAIHVRLTGADETTLKAAAETVKAALARYPAASGVEDDLAYDKPELIVSLTPRGEALGFTTASIAQALRQRLDGIEAVRLARGSQELMIKVRLPREAIGPAYLHQAMMPLPDGGFIGLTEIATINEVQGFSSIRRENGDRQVTVTGDLTDDAAASAEVLTALRDEILPGVVAQYGVAWSLGGLAEQESDFLSEAIVGFALAIAAIYIVLSWVFASWSRPLIVMLVIPLGLIGAVWGHWLHATPLSMFSVVGLIGMAGIIINDSIVLVTRIDERAKEQDLISAVIGASADRLRAVLLTTLTTVGGLAPLLLETSRQAQFLKPTVITLAYGLGFGMVLVLLIVPAMVAVQYDVARCLKSLRRLPSVMHRQRAISST